MTQRSEILRRSDMNHVPGNFRKLPVSLSLFCVRILESMDFESFIRVQGKIPTLRQKMR